LQKRFPLASQTHAGKSQELITFAKDRPGHDRRYAIDPSKAKTVLGYTPEETFSSGIAKTVEWYLTHEAWWRPLLDKQYADWIAQQYFE
jgi:dTDP-glucose 4,6-dehydratase